CYSSQHLEVKMSANEHSNLHKRTLLGSVGLLCSVVVLAGCGGSSSSSTTTQQARTQSAPDVAKGHARSAIQGEIAATGSTGHSTKPDAAPKHAVAAGGGGTQVGPTQAVQKARPTPATSNDDLNSSGTPKFNPCKLVSLSEAQTITGGAV